LAEHRENSDCREQKLKRHADIRTTLNVYGDVVTHRRDGPGEFEAGQDGTFAGQLISG